jgi:hypothetical protein
MINLNGGMIILQSSYMRIKTPYFETIWSNS